MELSNRILRFELNRQSSLLINPMSGAIDLVPTMLVSQMSDHMRRRLQGRGYFLSEDERIERLKELGKITEKHDQNVPYWFYVLTTLNCNFGCPICYEKNARRDSETNMRTIEAIIDSVARFQQERNIPNQKVNLVLFGGEPLCVSNQGIIQKLLESSQERGWKDVIVTNGSLVNRYIDCICIAL